MGTGFADFDSDGYRDLFIANGHLQDNVHLYDGTTAYEVRNQVLRQYRPGEVRRRLRPVRRWTAAEALQPRGDRRPRQRRRSRHRRAQLGAVNPPSFAMRAPAVIIGSRSACAVRTNRDGVGARVTVVAGDLTLVDEVHSGRGYQAISAPAPVRPRLSRPHRSHRGPLDRRPDRRLGRHRGRPVDHPHGEAVAHSCLSAPRNKRPPGRCPHLRTSRARRL